MGDDVRVDTDGLRSGAANSDALASALATGPAGGPTDSQPSHSGVSAILLSVQSVRGRQSGRVASDASIMRAGAGHYDDTDGHSATDIAQAM